MYSERMEILLDLSNFGDKIVKMSAFKRKKENRRKLYFIIPCKLKISIDEHVVARWTRKVNIPRTKHPMRGKAMKADKHFYVFELAKKRLLSVKQQPGNATLANTALKMIKELISKVNPKSVRFVMDATGTFVKGRHSGDTKKNPTQEPVII